MKIILQSVVFIGVAAQFVSAQSSIFGNNLIVNAGAESGPGGDATVPVSSVPGWSRTGGCDVYAYNAAYNNTDTISPQDIVPSGAGNNYFAGGVAPANCIFSQSIDLTSGAGTIDAGTASFAAAAYLGGYNGDDDNASMTVVFQDVTGKPLSSLTVGPVAPADRPYQESALYLRRTIGQVPAGARTAAVTLNMNWVDGDENEAIADNLSLILNAPAPPQSLLGINLIVNPGADASPGYDSSSSTTYASTDLPGWVRNPFVMADSYQDSSGDLYQSTGGPADAGANYFYGGLDVADSSNPVGAAFQDIDVSSAASLIDAGNTTYALAAWLGGYDSQNDNCVLTAQFQDWTGNLLGTGTIGPILSADRGGVTELLNVSTSGNVPVGTRVIHLLMTITRTDGTNNDGVADSLSLVLGPYTNLGPSVSGTVISAGAFGAFDSVASGTWMEIYGENLAADSRQWGGGDFNGVNAPTSLDGTSVTIGGQAAFVSYINPGQVNALVPGGLGSGPQPVTVTSPNGTSTPLMVSVNPAEPGLLAPASFNVNGNQYVVALFSDGQTFVMPSGSIPGVPSRDANPGETIVLYGIGFGGVTPNVPPGQIAEQANTLVTSPFQIQIDSAPAQLTYSGLAPSFVGLYQFNVIVPNIQGDDLATLTFTLGTTSSTQTLFTAVAATK